jgi:hypothetical protein
VKRPQARGGLSQGSSTTKNKEQSSSSIKSHRRGDNKKKMKKVVYYETDSSSPSTSSSESSTTSKRHERKKYSKMPLRYPRISKRAPLLSVPLGKLPYFDGEDYCIWSDKMRNHLTSLHESIWDIVEFGAQAPKVEDKDYDSDEVAQIREEYNKVQWLKSTKEIWDVLKTAHEGDKVTKITKHETIEGELGRFVLNKGEDPQAMYNRLKTMVNQVRNLGSTKWDDHEMVKVILRSLVFRNPTQVQLICGDPRYKLMSPKEVIGKFVSFELMIKDSKHIVKLEQGATSTPEVQPVAFKATEEEKESTPSRLPIDASKLDNEEMALIIKSFHQIIKQRRGKDYKSRSKRVCYRCGKSGHFIAKCLISSGSDRDKDMKGRRRRRTDTTKRRMAMRTYVGNGTPTRAPPTPPTRKPPTSPSIKVSSFQTSATSVSWLRMARRRRYTIEPTPNIQHLVMRVALVIMKMIYMLSLPALTWTKRKKLNELIETINEKDDLLESQEDFLIKENKKFVKLKNAYAQEVEKCKNLSKELSICHDSISSLRTENASLVSKNEKLNVCNETISILKLENDNLNANIEKLSICKASTSTVENVTICARCNDINVEAMDDHLTMIKQQNDHIAKLTTKITEHELENEKFKFARSMLYNGRRPSIKDGIVFQ